MQLTPAAWSGVGTNNGCDQREPKRGADHGNALAQRRERTLERLETLANTTHCDEFERVLASSHAPQSRISLRQTLDRMTPDHAPSIHCIVKMPSRFGGVDEASDRWIDRQ